MWFIIQVQRLLSALVFFCSFQIDEYFMKLIYFLCIKFDFVIVQSTYGQHPFGDDWKKLAVAMLMILVLVCSHCWLIDFE